MPGSSINFDKFFKLVSYLVVFSGFLSLWVSGSLGLAASVLFLGAMALAWLVEETRWQINERVGTVLIFIIVPIFYFAWKYQFIAFATSEIAMAGVLSRLILVLSVIKLVQKKGDRDWLFLYLMAFFEVLLAAALSISPLYLGSLILYLFITVLAIVAIEIRKTSRRIEGQSKQPASAVNKLGQFPVRKLPLTAFALLALIVVFAAPMFFMLPRVGGAGFGANQNGLSGMTGFSDRVSLGAIGRIQQNDQIVMRVRVENKEARGSGRFRWRGVALDQFDNRNWRQSKQNYREPYVKGEKDFFLVDFSSSGRADTVNQTFYLEPIDTPVLFTLARPLAIQGNFDVLSKDAEGGISFARDGFERISYKVYSDGYVPPAENLRKDNLPYPAEEIARYLQLPDKYDRRISALAADIARGKTNRYDKARAIEEYLQTQFGYTLEQKASGEEPVADFLFNVREGHCEYFATAMAVMLRTQGIAARVVNGFQQGEYNEAADVFVVRQKNAHSWVEVYFPKERAWVTFDPTPSAGQNLSSETAGLFGGFAKYLEALETFWIQYFVAYDNQEQRSLFRSMKNGFADFQTKMTDSLTDYQHRVQDWWREVRGEKGFQASLTAIAYGALYLFLLIAGFYLCRWLYRKAQRLEFWARLSAWLRRKNQQSIVEFYERMQRVLATQGLRREPHQTPLEFAFALNMPEAVRITEKYNRVRFGEKNLSRDEAQEIEKWLRNLERKQS